MNNQTTETLKKITAKKNARTSTHSPRNRFIGTLRKPDNGGGEIQTTEAEK